MVHTPPPAAPAWNSEGWTLLGSQTVDGHHDRDTIPVNATHMKDKVSELTLVVADSDLQLESLVVHFGNGTTLAPPLKHVFREGQRTRAIELPGPHDRYIKSIDLQYSNIPGGGRARVEIWGRDTKQQVPPAPPPAPVWNSTGWEQLGNATVQGKTGKMDKDTIPVGQRQGKYDAVTLVVLDSDLQMDEVTIVMGNKERYTPKLKHAFKEGQRTQAIPLPHGNRFIDHVELTYSNLPGGGNARVEVWGKPAKAPK